MLELQVCHHAQIIKLIFVIFEGSNGTLTGAVGIQNENQLSVVAHSCSPSSWEAQGQPRLYSKSEATLCYIVTQCLGEKIRWRAETKTLRTFCILGSALALGA